MDLIRAYEVEKDKEIEFFFYSNGESIFHDFEFFNAYVKKMSIGMRMKYVFYELKYWEHHNISYLLYLMHITRCFIFIMVAHIIFKK